MSLEVLFAITTTIGIVVAYWIGKQVATIKMWLAMSQVLSALIRAMGECKIDREKIDKITAVLKNRGIKIKLK